jgi:hypothetical protein
MRWRITKVTDTSRTNRSGETGLSSRAAWRLLTRRRRTNILLIETALIMVVALVGHMTGREMGRRHVAERDLTIQQLREERQELSADLSKRGDRISELQIKLNQVQAALDEIVPSENVFLIRPNQSLVVGGGRLTLGLVGSPTNQSVTLNINNKPRVAAVGDVITVTPDEATTCNVTVQSFDMFKANIHAACSTKPR